MGEQVRCSRCPLVFANYVAWRDHSRYEHGFAASFEPIDPVPEPEVPPVCRFKHRFTQEDFLRAHALGVVIDDVLPAKALRQFREARTAAGWPNDGGGRR